MFRFIDDVIFDWLYQRIVNVSGRNPMMFAFLCYVQLIVFGIAFTFVKFYFITYAAIGIINIAIMIQMPMPVSLARRMTGLLVVRMLICFIQVINFVFVVVLMFNHYYLTTSFFASICYAFLISGTYFSACSPPDLRIYYRIPRIR